MGHPNMDEGMLRIQNPGKEFRDKCKHLAAPPSLSFSLIGLFLFVLNQRYCHEQLFFFS